MRDQGFPFRDKPGFVAAIVLSAVVVSGLGIFRMLTGYVPGWPTRLDYMEPIVGVTAQQLGLPVAILGLLPLCLLARTRRQATYAYAVLLAAVALKLAVWAAIWNCLCVLGSTRGGTVERSLHLWRRPRPRSRHLLAGVASNTLHVSDRTGTH